MALRQAVQLFVLALAGTTLAGCIQHTVAERSMSLSISPQAPPAQAAPQRPAAVLLNHGTRCLLQVIPVKGRTRDVFLSASAVAVLLHRPTRLKFNISDAQIRELFEFTDR